MGTSHQNDMRVLVWMPTVRDGERISASLAEEGLDCALCADLDALCRETGAGAGVVLLTEEALGRDRAGLLVRTLGSQPAWSDLPVVLLAREKASSHPSSYREVLNVSLVERPVRVRSLLSVIRAALRARRHQYDVRDHLEERERQTAALREQEERLQFALAAGRLGSWDLDLETSEMACSPLGKENYGRPPDGPFSYAELMEAVHPDDRDRMQTAMARAIADGSDYDIEYRNLWPDGTTHWVLVRGRATYAPDNRPLGMRGVSLDMTDRRRAEEGLRDSDRKKDDFLALLAHELRNPLAPLRNGLQVLRRTSDAGTRHRAEEMMDRQLGHMVRLIDDLLDVSRIDRNKMELRTARITLADAIGNAIETARPAIEAAGHEFQVSLPEQTVWLDADLTRLAQVFANLLTNSSKYTDRGGQIHLDATHEGDAVVITVRDTGIGIAADDLGTIFDMFSQVNRPVGRSTGGLGIGLALVRGLVEMHGGTVSASSGGPGRGSAFSVRLPAIPSRTGTGPVAQESTANRPSRSGLRILVVDDNRDSAESLAEILRLTGNEVAVAHDGLEGVVQAAAFRPELILMDLGMPRLDGLAATRQIREQPWGRDMAIVALTGWGQESDRLRSREAGCDAHLVKPASFDDIDRLVNDLVEGRAS